MPKTDKVLSPDDQYRKDMDEIASSLATKLVDGGLVNRSGFHKIKAVERSTNIRDTKRIIWDCFFEHFQAKMVN